MPTNTPRPRRALAVLAALGLTLAACGGDDSSSGSSAESNEYSEAS